MNYILTRKSKIMGMIAIILLTLLCGFLSVLVIKSKSESDQKSTRQDINEKSITVVKRLTEQGRTLSSMESCTGGGFANAITNVTGSSEVIKFSAVTYSNEYKVKMGVEQETIDQYSVYSKEVAKEMSKNISQFANSDYGIGITGKLKCPDENNKSGSDSTVFISIYDSQNNLFYDDSVNVDKSTRDQNKDMVIDKVLSMLIKII